MLIQTTRIRGGTLESLDVNAVKLQKNKELESSALPVIST